MKIDYSFATPSLLLDSRGKIIEKPPEDLDGPGTMPVDEYYLKPHWLVDSRRKIIEKPPEDLIGPGTMPADEYYRKLHWPVDSRREILEAVFAYQKIHRDEVGCIMQVGQNTPPEFFPHY